MKVTQHTNLWLSGGVFALGAYALWRAITANRGLDGVLIAIAEADAKGVKIDSLGHLVTGLMAGGHPLVVPMWAVYLVGISGLILMWLGSVTFLLAWRGKPVSTIFRRSYWTNFQASLMVDDHTEHHSSGDCRPPQPKRKKKAG